MEFEAVSGSERKKKKKDGEIKMLWIPSLDLAFIGSIPEPLKPKL